MAFLLAVDVIISILFGGLSLPLFFLTSFKLGLEDVDPVGAAVDVPDRVDLVLCGVECPEDLPRVDLLWEGDGVVVTFILELFFSCSSFVSDSESESSPLSSSGASYLDLVSYR